MSDGTGTARARVASCSRSTRETEIEASIDLDRPSAPVVSTGIPFFDHMLEQLGKHSGFGLELRAKGDLEVDAHHSVEDVGIVLGRALAEAAGGREGIRRFASLALPLDEALVNVALDVSGRPYLRYDVECAGVPLGTPPFDPQLAEEFWRAFAMNAALTLHISLAYGHNPHHILEASFKGVARALKEAIAVEGAGVPSTKGIL